MRTEHASSILNFTEEVDWALNSWDSVSLKKGHLPLVMINERNSTSGAQLSYTRPECLGYRTLQYKKICNCIPRLSSIRQTTLLPLERPKHTLPQN